MIENSPEYQKMVNQSLDEMNGLAKVMEKSGISKDEAEKKVAAIYLRNLQKSDDLVACAQKNIAELMTRIELDRAINPEEELVSKKYIQLFKLQNESLKLVQSMKPKQINHSVQSDNDKMVFDIKDGVYDEK